MLLHRRDPVVLNTRAEQMAVGSRARRPAPTGPVHAAGAHHRRATVCSASIVLENHEREYAFDDAEVRLLSDRRREPGRRARERAPVRRDAAAPSARVESALSEVGRDLSSTLDLATVMDRIAGHAKELLAAQNSAIFLPDADGTTLPRHRRHGDLADALKATVIEPGKASSAASCRAARPSSSTTPDADPRAVQIPGTEHAQRRAADGGAAACRRTTVEGRDGGLAHRRQPVRRRASSRSWTVCRARR